MYNKMISRRLCMGGWIFAALIVVPLLWLVVMYNRLITLRNEVKNAWHQVDVQLKRRYDLIPNLVTVVKGFMEFEKETLEKVTLARTGALYSRNMQERAASENLLTEALDRLFIVMENYPVLKSNENVMHLQEELVTTENRISFSRQLYNDLAANYRTRIEVFPDNMVASLFSFQPAEFFSVKQADKSIPDAAITTARK